MRQLLRSRRIRCNLSGKRCKRAPAPIVAPFFYAQLLWATLLGWIVFSEIPDRWTLIGGAIVMSSGLYLLSRKRAKHKLPSADVSA